jgi:MGT family glycosyltransferase
LRILICTIGTYGDVNPSVVLAKELQSRGIEVEFATTSEYRELAAKNNLSFVPLNAKTGMEDPALSKLILNPKKGLEATIRKVFMPALRDTYHDLEESTLKADLIISSILLYAVPILAEKYNKPWASMILQPFAIASAYEPSILGMAPRLSMQLRRLGPRMNGWLISLLNKATRSWWAPLAKFRKELGLPSGKNPIFEWQYSSLYNLAMFSDRFGSAQPDWPKKLKICGFPFLDSVDEPLDKKVENFLLAGESPITFTLGSAAVLVDDEFYKICYRVSEKLNRRAVLVAGPHAEKLAPHLPSSIIALNWASFPGLFSQSLAVIHPGGIGTTAQALRAGIPQLVVPFTNDQFDNAYRVKKMGCGRVIFRKKLTEKSLKRELELLISDNKIKERAKREGDFIREERGVKNAADAIINEYCNNKALNI